MFSLKRPNFTRIPQEHGLTSCMHFFSISVKRGACYRVFLGAWPCLGRTYGRFPTLSLFNKIHLETVECYGAMEPMNCYEVFEILTYLGGSVLLALATTMIPSFVYYWWKTRKYVLYEDRQAYKTSIIISTPVTLFYIFYCLFAGRILDLIHVIMWCIIAIRIVVISMIIFWIIFTTKV